MAAWMPPVELPEEVGQRSKFDPYCWLVDLAAVLAETENLISGPELARALASRRIRRDRRRAFALSWGQVPLPSDPELYLLFDRSPIGMYRSNREGRFTYVNSSLAKMLGYTVDELLAEEPQPRRLRRSDGPRADHRTVPARARRRRRRGRVPQEGRRHDHVQLWGHAIELGDGTMSFDASVLDISRGQTRSASRSSAPRRSSTSSSCRCRRCTGSSIASSASSAPAAPSKRSSAIRAIGSSTCGSRRVHRFEPGSVDPVPYHERALDGEPC